MRILTTFFALIFSASMFAQSVDYSVVYVPEESGIDFRMITSKNDYVCMPIVKRGRGKIDWYTNRIIDLSKDGKKIAYLAMRGDATNIFVKELERQGTSVQRTNRKAVTDFSYSADGTKLTFSESSMRTNVIFQTDAVFGEEGNPLQFAADGHRGCVAVVLRQQFEAVVD